MQKKKNSNPADNPPKGERIAKIIARAGLTSRRGAEAAITAGRVSVNGHILRSPALNVEEGDRILFDGRPLPQAAPASLWRYHKPIGLVTSMRDEKGRRTIFDTLPEDLPRLMSVGRLDLNSEGLLLLTNDGALKRHLELPSTGWTRKYRVRVHGKVSEAGLERLRSGITLEGEIFRPMQIMLDREQGKNAWLSVGLREGKNREIRRAMAEIGLQVTRLIRISYGPFQLGTLTKGAVSPISAKMLRAQLGAWQ